MHVCGLAKHVFHQYKSLELLYILGAELPFRTVMFMCALTTYTVTPFDRLL